MIEPFDIIRYRKENGISQEDFAKLIGVSRNTVYNYEKGDIIPENKAILIERIIKEKVKVKEYQATFSERLIGLIKEREITSYYLSKKTGVSNSTISKLIYNVNDKPNIKTVEKLASFFNVNTEWLLTGVGERKVLTELTIKDEEVSILMDELAIFQALMLSNSNVAEFEVKYTNIEVKISLIHTFVKEYGLSKKLTSHLSLNRKKVLSNSQLGQILKEEYKTAKDLYDIIAEYEPMLEELCSKVMQFNKEHDKLYTLPEDY